jgi:sugar O-acyltransferase (sialic acid O-acetyltransferase NeuD family)
LRFPLIVMGGGGHARVLIDALLLQSCDILGYTDPDEQLNNTPIQGINYIGDDQVILSYKPSEIRLVNGLGSIGSTKHRKKLFESFKQQGYTFANVLHPSAVISRDSILLEGVQIMAGAIVQAGSHIGANTIINTKASIDHDCQIGAHVHLAPGVTLSGNVKVEDGVHIGTGATVIQQIQIHSNSIIGAGALVLRNISANRTVYGVPAKEVEL